MDKTYVAHPTLLNRNHELIFILEFVVSESNLMINAQFLQCYTLRINKLHKMWVQFIDISPSEIVGVSRGHSL